MILLAMLLGSMSFADWEGSTPAEQQQIGIEMAEEYLQREPFCTGVRVFAVRHDDTVLFEGECLEVQKTNV